MHEPDEPFVIPMGRRESGHAKWVVLAVAAVVAALGGWLALEHFRDRAAADQRAQAKKAEEAELEKRREARRKQAGSGIPLSEAHKPPPGYTPPKSRVPSRELFSPAAAAPSGLLPVRLPGGHFGIQLPATWDHTVSGSLSIIEAPEDHFRIVVASGTHADDGNTKQAIDSIGAVNCDWRRGDGPRHGQLGTQRVPAFFNEGICGHTDGYGLIWIVRVYAGDDVTSLVARYSPTAGENAEDVLLGVLKTIAPLD